MRFIRLTPLRVTFLLLVCCCLAPSQTDEATVHARLAKHSQLFEAYESGRRLEERKPGAAGVVDLSVNMRNLYFADSQSLRPDDELIRAAKWSDAVVEGTAVQQYSALTPRHSFVFSDWTITVSKVFKNSSSIPIIAGGEIIATRPGGDVVVGGQRVMARDRSFPDFRVGHQYVLYLRALPGSSSFQVMSHALFDVSGSSPIPLLDPDWTTTSLRTFATASTPDFLASVERSIAR